MTPSIDSARLHLPEHQFDFLAGSSVVLHGHHFNLLWDQTMDDALGQQIGRRVRTRASHKASYKFLRGLVDEVGAATPVERLRLAATVFGAMGHGKLHLAVGRSGGLVRGEQLHYGFGWSKKYGGRLSRCDPADAFATGFSAAATEVAYNLDPGSRRAAEDRCIVDGSAGCSIRVSGAGAQRDPILALGVDPASAKEVLPPSRDGRYEDQIAPIVPALRERLWGLAGDDRGVIEAFGVLVTAHLADYYNHAASDVLEILAEEKPGGVEAFRALLREAGAACAFHTFGGVLASEDWEGLVGSRGGDPLEVVIGCAALARALGFGRWAVEEFQPETRLVMTSPGTCESVFSRLFSANAARGPGGIFVGAGVGIMQLAHGVRWQRGAQLDHELYLQLARSNPWTVTQESSFAAGDALDRIVVTRR